MGEETDAAQMNEMVEEVSAANRMLLDALKRKSSDPGVLASDYNKLKLTLGTYMALVATMLGQQSSIYKKCLKNWKVLDLELVEEKQKQFTATLCHEIQWAYLKDSREYFLAGGNSRIP